MLSGGKKIQYRKFEVRTPIWAKPALTIAYKEQQRSTSNNQFLTITCSRSVQALKL